MKKKCFLDMDGVLADFDRQAGDLKKINDRWAFWEEVAKHKDFWLEMPLMPKALELFSFLCKHFEVIILSKVPTKACKEYQNQVAQDKEAWIRKYISKDIKVITANDKKGPYLTCCEDILVDDRECNIQNWQEHGGIGILYQNYEQFLDEFAQLYDYSA